MNNEIKVVIVEDILEIRETLQALIGNHPGFHCAGAYTSAEGALAEIPYLKPDVVLMDINLPGINGVEAVRRLKADFTEMKFLICTVFEDDEKIFQAMKAGAGGYILKNNSPEKILDAIKDVYDGGAPMSALIAKKVINAFLENRSIHSTTKNTLLTEREMEVLELLSKGFHYKEVGYKLEVSIDTVRSHCRNIYEKLHVTNKVEAINIVFGKKLG